MRIRHLFLAAMTMFALGACTFIPEPPYEFPNINEDVEDELPPEGSVYTVTQAIKAYNSGITGNKTVKGYIVGAMNSNNNYTAEFGTTSVKSNILIADNAEENSEAECLIVQLSSGTDIRTALNLADNPGNYKKEVVVTGSLEKYFNAAGLKNLTSYELDGITPEQPTEPEVPADAYINETFATTLGKFTTIQTTGEFPWVIEYNCAKVSAYENDSNDSEKNNAAESWLISPAIDFSSEKEAYISFDYVICYTESGKVEAYNQLLISDNYSENVETANWTTIDFCPTENTSWNFTNSGKIAIPAQYIGKNNVTFAFKYISTETKAGTWEIKNVIVASGAGDTPSTPETPETPETPDTPVIPVVPEGENLLLNGNLEAWSDDLPVDWATISSVSTATISKSTENYEGEYSSIVHGNKENTRFASKSYILEAGTYCFSAYVKANGDEAGFCRLGYVLIQDGAKKGNYKYGAAAAAVTDEWIPRVYEFTLNAPAELSLVIMNHEDGKGASFLVDDIRLVRTE